MISNDARLHLIKYWNLSVSFFEEADYALASFFAITLMEEVGKVIILGNKGYSDLWYSAHSATGGGQWDD